MLKEKEKDIKKYKYFRIFVTKYPESESGYVSLPSDNKTDKILLVNSKKNAHLYENKEHGKGDFEDWKKIFEEELYFYDRENDLREPKITAIFCND